MASEREELTAEERARLARMCQTPLGRKALRLLDAHAADRTALVAQLEAAKERYGWLLKRAQCDGFVTVSELAEELEALAAPPAGPTHAALVAQLEARVRELDTVNAHLREEWVLAAGALKEARAIITELREHIPQDRRPGSLFRRSGAHLSNQPAGPQPAATARTEAEQRVLDACAALSDEWLKWLHSDWCTWQKVADAELARREALRG